MLLIVGGAGSHGAVFFETEGKTVPNEYILALKRELSLGAVEKVVSLVRGSHGIQLISKHTVNSSVNFFLTMLLFIHYIDRIITLEYL